MPSRQDILEDLQRVFGGAETRPTADNYRKHGRYSMGPIYSEFDNWPEAKEAAGVNRELENPRKIDRELLIEDIQRVQKEVSGVVTYADYRENGDYSMSVLERRFDGWRNARLSAGIDKTPAAYNRISDDEAKQALRTLSEKLERTPRRFDVETYAEFSYSMYERKFGSWNNALIEAGFDVNQPTDGETTKLDCDYCGNSMIREVADTDGKENVFCSKKCYWEFLRENAPSGKEHTQYDRVKRDCAFCGETLEIKPSVSENRNRVFCDYSCAGRWRSENLSGDNSPRWKGGDIEKHCEICGKSFEVKRARADSARFCSYECLGVHHREVRSGEDNPNWEGGYEPYYGPNWREQRERTLKRDGYVCVDCGMTQEESRNKYAEGLSVHHRVPFREFRVEGNVDYQSANDLENLVALCRFCHKKWEHLPVQYQVQS